MNDLADKKCIPCEGGIPSFNLEEIHKYLKKVDDGMSSLKMKKIITSPRILNLIIFRKSIFYK